MNQPVIPYQAIDWTSVPRMEYKGESGTSFWRTLQLPGLRIRIVEYSPGYLADHWCQKGHIVHCLEGEFVNEQQDGAKTVMRQGMTYVVSDGASSHRSRTENGATLLIVDGDFLKL
ncbi:MAG: DHCW motif cupin fold protein [Candidatus Aminicenantes bacterium]|nr:DHCW motif cupin fold protein [Candidatus Aminicenantes bacterium]